jgi:hypothetical protein
MTPSSTVSHPPIEAAEGNSNTASGASAGSVVVLVEGVAVLELAEVEGAVVASEEHAVTASRIGSTSQRRLTIEPA